MELAIAGLRPPYNPPVVPLNEKLNARGNPPEAEQRKIKLILRQSGCRAIPGRLSPDEEGALQGCC